MNKIKEGFKKVLYVLVEKNGVIKMISCMILFALLFWVYNRTGVEFYKWLSFIFGGYAALMFLILMVYAWIINPIKDIKENRRLKKLREDK